MSLTCSHRPQAFDSQVKEHTRMILNRLDRVWGTLSDILERLTEDFETDGLANFSLFLYFQ